jgi:hypothetical protein
MALRQQPTREAKTLCSASHRREGTLASSRLLVQDGRHSAGVGSWLLLCSGSEVELTDSAPSHSAGRRRAAMQSGEWSLGLTKSILTGRIRPRRRVVLLCPRMVSSWEKVLTCGPGAMRRWGRQVGPMRQRIFQITKL